MIAAITGLLFCQLLGEVLVRALLLPLPGPVAGLGLLFCYLVLRGRANAARDADEDPVPPDLAKVCDTLLRNLSLLFIPAAVGVIKYLDLIRAYAGQIAIAIAVSTTMALIVTATTFRFVSRLHAFRHKDLVDDISAAVDEGHHR